MTALRREMTLVIGDTRRPITTKAAFARAQASLRAALARGERAAIVPNQFA